MTLQKLENFTARRARRVPFRVHTQWRLTSSLLLVLLIVFTVFGFTQSPATPAGITGVLRLRVKVKSGDATKSLSRKRFFLIKGSLEQNKAIVAAVEQRQTVTRDCYYTSIGASSALINWLKENDCESVYCREIEREDVEGAKAVPEFASAFTAGEKEFGSADLSRRWLTTNLPEKVRDGFYKERENELRALIKQAEGVSGARVLSVMTDRNGTAYFIDLEPGTYFLSSLLATELGPTIVTWSCEVQVKAGDLATEKPYLVSNRKDKNVKCVGVEKPLPACAAPKSAGS
jgi:hypothetical protein